MNHTKLLRELCPPLLWRAGAALCRFAGRGRAGFRGDFASWGDARRQCTGYDADAIAQKTLAGALRVRNGEGVFERDSVVFSHVEYDFPLLAALLTVAAHRGGKLHVVDFGGSLGSTFVQHRRLLRFIPDLRWDVVEQAHLVELGRHQLETAELTFHHSVEDCLKQGAPDILLLSSVLPYLQDPYGFIRQVSAHRIPFIVLNRTAFVTGRERLTIQHVSPAIYEASYPAWFFEEQKLLAAFSGYETVLAWDSADVARLAHGKPYFRGFLLARGN